MIEWALKVLFKRIDRETEIQEEIMIDADYPFLKEMP
jgi:hypothetical protein